MKIQTACVLRGLETAALLPRQDVGMKLVHHLRGDVVEGDPVSTAAVLEVSQRRFDVI
jgi:hypothetical protein